MLLSWSVLVSLAFRLQDLLMQLALVISEVQEMFRFKIQVIDSDFEYLEEGVSKIFSISLTYH